MSGLITRTLMLAMLAMLCTTAFADDLLALRLTARNIHDATLRILEDGTAEVHTTGTDPYLFTEPVPPGFDPRLHRIFAFEYFSATGTDHLQVFVLPPLSEANSVMGAGLNVSEGWSPRAVDLKPVLDKNGGRAQSLRIDLGTRAGRTVRLRGLSLRPQSEAERRLDARREGVRLEQARYETRLRNYLKHDYPYRIDAVRVTTEEVRISGEAGTEGALTLVEAPIYLDVTLPPALATGTPVRPDRRRHFTITLPRHATEHGRNWDRLLSRWALAAPREGAPRLLSHYRYADSIVPAADLPEMRPRNRKGLGGFGLDRPLSDIEDLGISAVTVNIVLNSFMYTRDGAGRTPFQFGGRTWYADDANTSQMDRTMLAAAERHLLVSAIILLGQPGNAPANEYVRLAAHPDTDPSGIFAMPAVTSEEGLVAYAAALDFLARRYSRQDGRYGRIHHWILHNEVNAGWVWTNAGEKTMLLYMDLYQRSMRTAYLIARQYNPWARVFISLEHHWTEIPTARIYSGRDMLETLAEFCRAEGDFDWSVAFHPYPENLFEPRVWLDKEVDFTFNTAKITFKNLEVLDAWMQQPRMRYLGSRLRAVHLSEQGLNSRDYGEDALRNQAAGMAYAWNKLKCLPSIEMFHYHNWVDNRGEGGLRIGLRKFPDDEANPLGKKPIWTVYRALGTAAEAKATAFALPLIGIASWSEIRHKGAIR